MATGTVTMTALEDPPEVAQKNPIHDGPGAKAYGYERPIVAGIHSYGWAVGAILQALGDGWLSDGWAEIALKRPVYAEDIVTSTVDDDGVLTQVSQDDRVTIEGRVGLGRAPWFDEFRLPTDRTPVPVDPKGPFLTPSMVPTDGDLPAMQIVCDAAEAKRWAKDRLGDLDERWHDGDAPIVHPSWSPGHMTELMRHSHRFPAGIHATGRIQHLREHRAGEPVIVAGRWGNKWERKSKTWSDMDAVFLHPDGTELAYIRQTAVMLEPLPR